MTVAFVFIASVTLAAAAVAMTLRNLIHSALLLIGSWAGIAAFYLWCGAEFLAFAQVLVYIGAVSMIVLFAVLLTRHAPNDFLVPPESLARALPAVGVGGAVFGVLAGAVISAAPGATQNGAAPSVTVREIGLQLMGPHAASLLVAGVLLTVSLLGAIVLASAERDETSAPRAPSRPSPAPPPAGPTA